MTENTQPHDIFEGEIPSDLGKKKSAPIWLKAVGLVALVGVLGTAALMLEQDNEFTVEPGIDITDSIPVMTEPENAEIQIAIDESVDQAPVQDEIPSVDQDSLTDVDLIAMENDDNAIVITPPAQPNLQPPISNSETVNADLQDEVSQIASRLQEIEANESERITVVKSGIELHAQSVEKLNDLLRSLDGLKKELAALKAAPTTSSAPKPSNNKPATQQAAPNAHAKPAINRKTDELNLIGIDSWGGQRFAQIEYAGEIHLLASNEEIGSWRLESISKDSIVVKNQEGESFELSI
jgi:hypothetical protein